MNQHTQETQWCEAAASVKLQKHQNGLRAAEQEIQRETRRLEELQAEEEKKREAVVEAKKDTSSIEKLKEKKLDAYRRAEAKSEETFIEEFVSTMRVNAANA